MIRSWNSARGFRDNMAHLYLLDLSFTLRLVDQNEFYALRCKILWKEKVMGSSTYSICGNCNQVNRVLLDPQNNKMPVCGKCKSALPIHGGVSDLQTSTAVKMLSEKISIPVIVDFWAPWCQPCLAFAPVFKEASRTLAGHAVLTKINTESNPIAGEFFQIRGIPTLVVIDKGVETTRLSGSMSLPQFLQWVKDTIGYDRDNLI